MTRKIATVICGALLAAPAAMYAQDFPPLQPPDGDQQQQQGPPQQPLPPEQLDSLVAPIALYPDSLLSQVLVASTYPLELVEANQWLSQNGGLQGQALVDAAKQQNWDPSIQALVIFPDVLRRLTQDIRWTTSLGNAFLAQQADVMSAVQDMRQRAQQTGKLQDTPQQRIITQNEGGQPVIEIEPANPQVIYVPTYNPAYIWGPPAYGYYPPLYYPGVGIGFGFGGGISIGAFFGGGWGGWGWHPNWGGRSIIVNNNFFHRYGYSDFHGAAFRGGPAVWSHDPGHRLGVPYSNRSVASEYRGSQNFGRGAAAPQSYQRNNFAGPQSYGGNGGRGNAFSQAAPQQREAQQQRQAPQQFQAPQQREAPRSEAAPQQRFGSQQFEQRNNGGNRSAFSGVQDGNRARTESDHGFSSMRSAPAPAAHGGGGERGGGGGGEHGGGGGHRR